MSGTMGGTSTSAASIQSIITGSSTAMCGVFVLALVAILVAWKFMIEGLIE
jgi:hypothetical protein